MTTSTTTGICAGCNTEKPRYTMNSDNFVDVKLAPGKTALVCRDLRNNNIYSPKESCAVKAVVNSSLCPGCGEKIGGIGIGRLCNTCITNLDRAKNITTEKLATHRFEDNTFGYHGTSYEGRRELAHAFAVAVAGSGARCGSWLEGGKYVGQPFADVTQVQLAAIERVTAMFKDALRKAVAEGEETGQGFIHQLAKGEASVNDFNEAQARLGREKQKG